MSFHTMVRERRSKPKQASRLYASFPAWWKQDTTVRSVLSVLPNQAGSHAPALCSLCASATAAVHDSRAMRACWGTPRAVCACISRSSKSCCL